MSKDKPSYWIVVIAALGYFVDIYDLILFNVVKEASLTAIGVTGDDFKSLGGLDHVGVSGFGDAIYAERGNLCKKKIRVPRKIMISGAASPVARPS